MAGALDGDPREMAAAAIDALNRGDAAGARSIFERLVAGGFEDRQVMMGAAIACWRLKDFSTAHGYFDRILKTNNADLRALILKADCYVEQGDERAAASFYNFACKVAENASGLPPEAQADLERARRFSGQVSERTLDRMKNAMRAVGYDEASAPKRLTESVEIMAGVRKRYIEDPQGFYYAGLPAVGYFEREHFPWLGALEAATDDIAAELSEALAGPESFVPYSRPQKDRPVNYANPLLNSMDWSALFLVDEGAVQDHAARFPKTMAALEKTDLQHIDGIGPMILFSRLRPGAHIRPHTGYLNTRLVCHLPLVVPEGCFLRVGAETRTWRRGEAFVFNDTIEHEAWNESREDRIILLFTVWRPELTADERRFISALSAEARLSGGGDV